MTRNWDAVLERGPRLAETLVLDGGEGRELRGAAGTAKVTFRAGRSVSGSLQVGPLQAMLNFIVARARRGWG